MLDKNLLPFVMTGGLLVFAAIVWLVDKKTKEWPKVKRSVAIVAAIVIVGLIGKFLPHFFDFSK